MIFLIMLTLMLIFLSATRGNVNENFFLLNIMVNIFFDIFYSRNES